MKTIRRIKLDVACSILHVRFVSIFANPVGAMHFSGMISAYLLVQRDYLHSIFQPNRFSNSSFKEEQTYTQSHIPIN